MSPVSAAAAAAGIGASTIHLPISFFLPPSTASARWSTGAFKIFCAGCTFVCSSSNFLLCFACCDLCARAVFVFVLKINDFPACRCWLVRCRTIVQTPFLQFFFKFGCGGWTTGERRDFEKGKERKAKQRKRYKERERQRCVLHPCVRRRLNVMTILKDEHFKSHFVCTVSKINLKCNVMTILKDEHFKSHFVCTVSKSN